MKMGLPFAMAFLVAPIVATAGSAKPESYVIDWQRTGDKTTSFRVAKYSTRINKFLKRYFEFSECAVGGKKDTARKLFETNVSVDAQRQKEVFSSMDSSFKVCLSETKLTSVSTSYHLLVGLLGRALYLSENYDGTTIRQGPLLPSQADPDNLASEMLYDISDCIVARHGPLANSFVRAEFASQDEDNALKDFGKDFEICVEDGISIEVSVLEFKAAVGSVLYRRSAGLVGVAE